MQILFNCNFDPEDIADGDFQALFAHRRRDATFAFAFKSGERIYALRDHLGIIPLYYRIHGANVRFSTSITDLVTSDDDIDPVGLLLYLKRGTPRLYPLIEGIEIVPPGAVIEIDPAQQASRLMFQYQFQPRRIPVWTSMRQLVEEAEALFSQAVRRLVKHDIVGLYLSGGIDSTLTGIYLRRFGVEVNAYTSAPWGQASSEIPFAKLNAQVVHARQHHIDYLETDAYQALFEAMTDVYGMPHGTTTGLGVASLWQNTPIAGEQQVFFGQNNDTMTCSGAAQYIAYFSHLLPGFVRRRIHSALHYQNMIDNYFSLAFGYVDLPVLQYPRIIGAASKLQQLALAGMYIVQTPADGEVLSQPAVHRGILVSDPYYDIDLAEFCLGVPLRHRLALTRQAQTYVALEKRIFQHLALRYLPDKVVRRKKGFAISFDRDERTRRLAAVLPDSLMSVSLGSLRERFAGGVLKQWGRATGLRHLL
jgi:hypothetical protein